MRHPVPMPILTEPVPAATLTQLRHAVLKFRQLEHRRIYPTRILIGHPDGLHHQFEVPPPPPRVGRGPTAAASVMDAAQRVDVVGALLDRWLMAEITSAPLLWLIRPGSLDGVHDLDADWLAAGYHAFGECRVELTMVVITRRGWFDPRSRVARRWKRLRAR